MLHLPHLFASKGLVITKTGGVEAKAAAKNISGTLSGIGFNRCLIYRTASFSWNYYSPTKKTLAILLKITNKFYKDILSKKLLRPAFGLLIPNNLFRGM